MSKLFFLLAALILGAITANADAAGSRCKCLGYSTGSRHYGFYVQHQDGSEIYVSGATYYSVYEARNQCRYLLGRGDFPACN